eukprot:scaffold133279_cov69-Phaeocystis_antarctica.AAC.7
MKIHSPRCAKVTAVATDAVVAREQRPARSMRTHRSESRRAGEEVPCAQVSRGQQTSLAPARVEIVFGESATQICNYRASRLLFGVVVTLLGCNKIVARCNLCYSGVVTFKVLAF